MKSNVTTAYDRHQQAADETREMPSEQLELEITELAAHVNAATCRWLGLIAELDRREAWAEWGASPARPGLHGAAG